MVDIKTRFLRYDVGFGRHNNIPDCCIKFFITWWEQYSKTKLGEEYRDRFFTNEKWNHIPCPSCLTSSNYKENHRCASDNTECRKWNNYRQTRMKHLRR